MSAVEQIFPLVPRRPLLGVSYAAMRSARRGVGTDVAGSRAYIPGDDVDTIDWAASARLSSASGLDQFVVRERYAEEAPWVVVLADARRTGWTAALERFRTDCLEIAPPPELAWEEDDQAVAH